jgi:S1-C subfamily serine protease
MNTTPKKATVHRSFTSCMVVILLVTAFVVGGLLGGIAGGSLILWAMGGQSQPTPEAEAPPPTVVPTVPAPLPPPTASSTPSLPLSPTSALDLSTPSPSIPDVVGQVLPAVVTVVNQNSGAVPAGWGLDSRMLGSGIVVDRRGYIVTNYHVIKDTGDLTIILSSGEELPARLVAGDEQQDLALIRAETGDLPAATWGDSESVRPGEWVVAIGSALGDFPNSVTVGVVSGLNRSLEMDNLTIEGLIQTDAAINKGNSGGPLVNLRGEVIGINTFIIREGRTSGVAEGMGFAIPSVPARQLTEEWIVDDASTDEQ